MKIKLKCVSKYSSTHLALISEGLQIICSQVCLLYWSQCALLACCTAYSMHDNAQCYCCLLQTSITPSLESLSSNSPMINQFQLPHMWSIIFSLMSEVLPTALCIWSKSNSLLLRSVWNIFYSSKKLKWLVEANVQWWLVGSSLF